MVNGAAGQGKGRAKEGRREEEIERKHEQAAAAGSQRLFAQAARQRKAGWQSMGDWFAERATAQCAHEGAMTMQKGRRGAVRPQGR